MTCIVKRKSRKKSLEASGKRWTVTRHQMLEGKCFFSLSNAGSALITKQLDIIKIDLKKGK